MGNCDPEAGLGNEQCASEFLSTRQFQLFVLCPSCSPPLALTIVGILLRIFTCSSAKFHLYLSDSSVSKGLKLFCLAAILSLVQAMGNCMSLPSTQVFDQLRTSKKIDSQLKEDGKKIHREIKMLLLGSGESVIIACYLFVIKLSKLVLMPWGSVFLPSSLLWFSGRSGKTTILKQLGVIYERSGFGASQRGYYQRQVNLFYLHSCHPHQTLNTGLSLYLDIHELDRRHKSVS